MYLKCSALFTSLRYSIPIFQALLYLRVTNVGSLNQPDQPQQVRAQIIALVADRKFVVVVAFEKNNKATKVILELFLVQLLLLPTYFARSSRRQTI